MECIENRLAVTGRYMYDRKDKLVPLHLWCIVPQKLFYRVILKYLLPRCLLPTPILFPIDPRCSLPLASRPAPAPMTASAAPPPPSASCAHPRPPPGLHGWLWECCNLFWRGVWGVWRGMWRGWGRYGIFWRGVGVDVEGWIASGKSEKYLKWLESSLACLLLK